MVSNHTHTVCLAQLSQNLWSLWSGCLLFLQFPLFNNLSDPFRAAPFSCTSVIAFAWPTRRCKIRCLSCCTSFLLAFMSAGFCCDLLETAALKFGIWFRSWWNHSLCFCFSTRSSEDYLRVPAPDTLSGGKDLQPFRMHFACFLKILNSLSIGWFGCLTGLVLCEKAL